MGTGTTGKRRRNDTFGVEGADARQSKSARLSAPRRDAVVESLDTPAFDGATATATPSTSQPSLTSTSPKTAVAADINTSTGNDETLSPPGPLVRQQESRRFWSVVATIPISAKGYDPMFPEFTQDSAGVVMPERKKRVRRWWKKPPEVKEAGVKAGGEVGEASSRPESAGKTSVSGGGGGSSDGWQKQGGWCAINATVEREIESEVEEWISSRPVPYGK